MKAVRTAAIAAAALLLAGICIFLCVDGLSNSRDAAWYADYTAKHGNLLKQIADDKGILQPSLRTKWILNRGKIESIHFDPDRTLFFLKTAIPEGYYVIVYASDETYIPQSLGFYDNWKQAETADGSLLWEGGMSGKAYIRLHNLGNGFYLEEAYLPT